jgi:hypothetical protein
MVPYDQCAPHRLELMTMFWGRCIDRRRGWSTMLRTLEGGQDEQVGMGYQAKALGCVYHGTVAALAGLKASRRL